VGLGFRAAMFSEVVMDLRALMDQVFIPTRGNVIYFTNIVALKKETSSSQKFHSFFSFDFHFLNAYN
jgi:hypothetical protein